MGAARVSQQRHAALIVKPSGLQCVRDFSFKKFRNSLGGGLEIAVSYRAKSQSLARGRDGADNRAGVRPALAWREGGLTSVAWSPCAWRGRSPTSHPTACGGARAPGSSGWAGV